MKGKVFFTAGEVTPMKGKVFLVASRMPPLLRWPSWAWPLMKDDTVAQSWQTPEPRTDSTPYPQGKVSNAPRPFSGLCCCSQKREPKLKPR